ncbi:MAG: ABC transporter permease [Bacteroidota bacterium]
MITHYFKLVWAKRKVFILVMTTLCISFVLISFFGTMLHREALPLLYPMGFELENNHLVHLSSFSQEADTRDTSAVGNFISQVKQVQERLESHPEIQAVSISSTFPTSGGYSQFWSDETDMYLSHVDLEFNELFKLEIEEGRWFTQEDYSASFIPLIVSKRLSKALFGKESGIGKELDVNYSSSDNYPLYEDKKFRIIGVVNNYRIQMAGGGMRNTGLLLEDSPRVSSWDQLYRTRIAIRSGSHSNKEELEEIVENALATLGTDEQGNGIKLNSMISFNKKRTADFSSFLFALAMGGFVAIILLSNVAIGIFGVFWQNVLRRFNEVGIRRAMGSTGQKVRTLILGEALALTLLAFVPGGLIYSQFIIFNYAGATWEHAIPAMIFSAVFLIILVLVCAVYPSWIASKIQPAEALREE